MVQSKPQVLFIGELNKSLLEYQQFSSKFECIDYVITSKAQLVQDLQTKFKNIEAIYGAWLGFVPVGGFRDDIIDACPSSLKVISICSVGYDGYDGERMKSKNIVLTNVPSVGAADPVADLVLYNTLTGFRNFHLSQRAFLECPHTVNARAALQYGSFDGADGAVRWGEQSRYAYGESTAGTDCHNPRGHHAVVVGFGQIGQLIGQRLSAVGMHIHYVKRTRLSAQQEASLGYPATYHSSLADATMADLVVIAAPGTPETKHMVNADIIEKFTKPFRIINVGRGTIIDEQALVNGLESGKVLFAGLDVYENEPHVHPKLLHRQDVLLTPHVGASTIENFDFTAVQALKNIENVLLQNGSGLNRVN
ncbi:hypothetical protein PSN45_001422 [Yamadazyma tenuis]|uniref:D-isomer specific 2-hydroxyacid dehydrogenase NAD-binding domain-containing protein n=1 Tax=Candida tenuis (strain ATCC 10573 / BCRC 21748 / CBS 615 / JCM 9827 / NBRC 10315 / NRRL Y-1498 / VKM Y-70) TaxID=590646 RepID=G3BC48_CANTC|nr:uncharacterized protein CANTEDRAFT_111417 [Yamadazyma tenuis ATCC 10573]EGV60785.1 hypothetical protein CANTEDRAFT_111417 [Yamadazyma tenuis ATCC 10573]WEJ93945.1 hypothetical protein PSN45_001422 [Yamadazyma tenuis]